MKFFLKKSCAKRFNMISKKICFFSRWKSKKGKNSFTRIKWKKYNKHTM